MPARQAEDPPRRVPSERLATVLHLHTRRGEPAPPPAADDTGSRRAAEFWREAFAEHGLGLDGHARIEDVLRIVGKSLEAVVTGLLYVREGGGPRSLPPNPQAGVDYTGASEVVGLLREMTAAPEVSRRNHAP